MQCGCYTHLQNDSRRSSGTSPKNQRSTGKKIRHGDRVEAKVKGWTKYYGGEVIRVNDDGTYDIKFDDGERKRGVKTSEIKGGKDDDDESDYDDRRSKRSKSPKKKSSTGKKTSSWRSCRSKSKRVDKILRW